jgi:hypothetical protein
MLLVRHFALVSRLYVILSCYFDIQEDVDHDESYVDGPRSSTLPEHWQTFSNTAAAAANGNGNSSSAAPRDFVRQESQVSGLQAPAGAVQVQQGSAEQMKVGTVVGSCWGSCEVPCVRIVSVYNRWKVPAHHLRRPAAAREAAVAGAAIEIPARPAILVCSLMRCVLQVACSVADVHILHLWFRSADFCTPAVHTLCCCFYAFLQNVLIKSVLWSAVVLCGNRSCSSRCRCCRQSTLASYQPPQGNGPQAAAAAATSSYHPRHPCQQQPTLQQQAAAWTPI